MGLLPITGEALATPLFYEVVARQFDNWQFLGVRRERGEGYHTGPPSMTRAHSLFDSSLSHPITECRGKTESYTVGLQNTSRIRNCGPKK
jgi:hypothetical protein